MIRFYERRLKFKGLSYNDEEVWIDIQKYIVSLDYIPAQESQLTIEYNELIDMILKGEINGVVKKNKLIVYDIFNNPQKIFFGGNVKAIIESKEIFPTCRELFESIPLNTIIQYVKELDSENKNISKDENVVDN